MCHDSQRPHDGERYSPHVLLCRPSLRARFNWRGSLVRRRTNLGETWKCYIWTRSNVRNRWRVVGFAQDHLAACALDRWVVLHVLRRFQKYGLFLDRACEVEGWLDQLAKAHREPYHRHLFGERCVELQCCVQTICWMGRSAAAMDDMVQRAMWRTGANWRFLPEGEEIPWLRGTRLKCQNVFRLSSHSFDAGFMMTKICFPSFPQPLTLDGTDWSSSINVLSVSIARLMNCGPTIGLAIDSL